MFPISFAQSGLCDGRISWSRQGPSVLAKRLCLIPRRCLVGMDVFCCHMAGVFDASSLTAVLAPTQKSGRVIQRSFLYSTYIQFPLSEFLWIQAIPFQILRCELEFRLTSSPAAVVVSDAKGEAVS